MNLLAFIYSLAVCSVCYKLDILQVIQKRRLVATTLNNKTYADFNVRNKLNLAVLLHSALYSWKRSILHCSASGLDFIKGRKKFSRGKRRERVKGGKPFQRPLLPFHIPVKR